MKKKTMDQDIEKGVEKGIVKGIEGTIKKYTSKKCDDEKSSCKCSHSGGCFYFLGFLGAAIYYISIATGFWNGVLGVLKAAVWPVFLVLELFKFIGA